MARLFARVADDRIVEIIEEIDDIETEWSPQFLALCVEITDLDPLPEIGWTLADDVFSPPEEPEVPPEQARARAVALGPIVTGAGAGSRFSVLPDMWQRLTEVALFIKIVDSIPGGATITWPTDPPVTFTDKADFLLVYRALVLWRLQWNKHVDGDGAAPADSIAA